MNSQTKLLQEILLNWPNTLEQDKAVYKCLKESSAVPENYCPYWIEQGIDEDYNTVVNFLNGIGGASWL